MPSWTRRDLLRAAAATAAVGLPGASAQAALAGSDRKFIFLFNYGGWDPTRVFTDEHANPRVAMERDAARVTRGDLSWVSHPTRPSVDGFFERWGGSSVVLNGLLVPSIAHAACVRLCLTGSTSPDRPDWGAIIGGTRGPDFPVADVVLSTASYPGPFGAYVTSTGSGTQLQDLVSGELLGWSDQAVPGMARAAEAAEDAYLARRAAGFGAEVQGPQPSRLAGAYDAGLSKSRYLKSLGAELTWDTALNRSRTALTVDLLARGVSRVVQLAWDEPVYWDTHVGNDAGQTASFEAFFADLTHLMERLEATPGTTAATLAEETVVVCFSEMGRTPALNSEAGKDHWPYTSYLLVGPGLTGGRTLGGYDAYYYGTKVDLATGLASDQGRLISNEVFGATLLRLAGIDSEVHLRGVPVLTGILA